MTWWFACNGPASIISKAKTLYRGLLLRDLHMFRRDVVDFLLSQYSVGSDQVIYIVEMKMQCWNQAPLRICGMGHYLERKQRETLRVCRSLATRGDNMMHPLWQELFLNDSPLAQEARDFEKDTRSVRHYPRLWRTALSCPLPNNSI